MSKRLVQGLNLLTQALQLCYYLGFLAVARVHRLFCLLLRLCGCRKTPNVQSVLVFQMLETSTSDKATTFTSKRSSTVTPVQVAGSNSENSLDSRKFLQNYCFRIPKLRFTMFISWGCRVDSNPLLQSLVSNVSHRH